MKISNRELHPRALFASTTFGLAVGLAVLSVLEMQEESIARHNIAVDTCIDSAEDIDKYSECLQTIENFDLNVHSRELVVADGVLTTDDLRTTAGRIATVERERKVEQYDSMSIYSISFVGGAIAAGLAYTATSVLRNRRQSISNPEEARYL